MKVIVVDDHPVSRHGLASIISLEKDVEICTQAGNINTAIKEIDKIQHDLVIVDLKLGNENGLDIIRKCKELGYPCKFMVLTSSADREDFRRAKELEVSGYVLKDASLDEILAAVRLINRGCKYYDPSVTELIMADKDENKAIEQLTYREREVLALLGEGLSNKEISNRLFVTEYTVKKHVSQVLAKLELKGRSQAALFANSISAVAH